MVRTNEQEHIRRELDYLKKQLDLVLHNQSTQLHWSAKMSQDFDEINGKMDRETEATAHLNDALTGIAQDIRDLKDQLTTRMTQDEVNQIKQKLEDRAAALEATAAAAQALDAENPEPA